ncbi:hypothetical protein K7I13_04715 [Brucepastera parasyntrophica]|uniref:tetratricopeptide repeat protein n=1 Tax=Brucepastera parasyntrophica TaxID=2880008 RepID=UPI00210CE3C1|nr:hypothetical protein [Brucepastera parasyntrophica]ULQ60588.1 hypothetical protein K7I13_04715 [Brucepastera parasyntrophica]
MELYPDEPLVYEYALWFFAERGDFDAVFELNNSLPEHVLFYTAIEEASYGNLDSAEESFNFYANDKKNAWTALANIGLLYNKRGEAEKAVDTLSLAAGMAPDNIQKSKLHYRIAVILVSIRAFERAKSVLGYAIELDRFNYPAIALLRKIDTEIIF